MLRRGTILGGSLLALLLFCSPSWAFPFRHPMMGGMPMHMPVNAFAFHPRAFPTFGSYGFGTPHFGSNFSFGRYGYGLGYSAPYTFRNNYTPFLGLGHVTNSLGPITRRVYANTPLGTFRNSYTTPYTFRSNYYYSPYGYSPYAYSPYAFSRYPYSPYSYSPYYLGANVRTYNPLTRMSYTTTPYGTFASTYGSAPGVVRGYNPATRIASTTTPFGTFASSYTGVSPSQFVSNYARAYAGGGIGERALWHEARALALINGYYPYYYGYGGYYPYGYPYSGYSNPYYAAGLGYGGYGGYGGGYGYGTGGGMLYMNLGNAGGGNAGGGNAPVAQAAPAAQVAPVAAQRPPSGLAAFGIPTEFGEVQWPLALRLMPPASRREMLDKLQSQMSLAADQSLAGKASVVLLRETKHTIDDARQWLQAHRGSMADNTYQDGVAFLGRLEDALRRMNL